MSARCRRCQRPMRLQKSSPQIGIPEHRSRGLCNGCWKWAKRHDVLIDYARSTHSRDDLLDDYVMLREQGCDWRECAQRLGMSYATFERAMGRARADGDPRAGRIGETWPAQVVAS